MNDSELEKIWNSPENQPDPAALRLRMEKSLRDLRRRRRGFVLMMSLAGFWLAAVAVRLGWAATRGGLPDFSHEWGAAVLFALPLAALILLVTWFRRHCRANPDPERSIHAGLLALLDENRLARLRTGIIAGLYAGVLLLTPLIVSQLRAAGKAGDEILIPAFVLLPLLLLTLLAVLIHHHRTRLLPRRRELLELLAAYQ